MSSWGAAKAKRVLAALLRLGWQIKRESGSHRVLGRNGWPDVVFHGLGVRWSLARPGGPRLPAFSFPVIVAVVGPSRGMSASFYGSPSPCSLPSMVRALALFGSSSSDRR
ncbi:MAG: type II toxin-antitoxin system HicA family toxin [Thioalkalivibrio sp.]|nr:type II toxin-antitoxin system HicA family toxin [Thioalkalivibrio sp.]